VAARTRAAAQTPQATGRGATIPTTERLKRSDRMKNARWLVVPMVSILMAACNGAGAPTADQAPTEPYSNLAQMMRGIPFPNSNIIFDTQTIDPAAQDLVGAHDTADGATALFQSVYGGWEAVENAALAVAETANLMLVPGRVCENGRPVPVDNEDFRRWSQELGEAGMEAYRAAQSRDQDEMIFVSGTITEACSNCHEVYRDKDDEADRCIP
jgi:hypothetical protein